MLQPVDRMPTAPPIPPMTVARAAGVNTSDAATSQLAGGSGGYVFSPEEIDAVITQWEDLYDDIESDERHALDVANVKAPGLEFASGDFTDAAGPSGEMLVEQIQRMKKYVGDYVLALKDAKQGVHAEEKQAAADMTDAGGGLL